MLCTVESQTTKTIFPMHFSGRLPSQTPQQEKLRSVGHFSHNIELWNTSYVHAGRAVAWGAQTAAAALTQMKAVWAVLHMHTSTQNAFGGADKNPAARSLHCTEELHHHCTGLWAPPGDRAKLVPAQLRHCTMRQKGFLPLLCACRPINSRAN